MTPQKALVLDANILLRAVFGIRVLKILKDHKNEAAFYAPVSCFIEAREWIPAIGVRQKKRSVAEALEVLEEVGRIVTQVEELAYGEFESEARARIQARDPDDWPVVAVALAIGCPIWTEDRDFFGSGIATWTTDRVEVYLESPV